MSWYVAVGLWLAANFFLLAATCAWHLWESALDRKAVKRAETKWAARHGIDLSYTAQPRFLGERR